MKDNIVIRGATVVALDAGNLIHERDVVIRDGRIAALGSPAEMASLSASASTTVIEAQGKFLLPGFVQTHIHLCQTLFRGSADDLSLIDWLKQRIWPLEAAHTRNSVRASARLGIAELIRGGTTCALTMETVHHTEAALEVVAESGFRAIVGKCMMDQGGEVPERLLEKTGDSIAASIDLIKRWNGYDDGRVRCCFAPRFALSCTKDLLDEVAGLSREYGVLVHTHASENRDEVGLVRQQTGKGNIEYLASAGLAAPNVVLAHCVHVDDSEIELLRETGAHVSHCPSSNLKLGSGIARVWEMLERGVSVSLGADGAPCNNRLDMFTEMRLAALLQKASHSPRAMPALTVLRLATIEGARALGLGDETGSIEIGKRADLQILNLARLHTSPAPDPVSTIVYSATPENVETVIIDGRVVMRDRILTTLDETDVIERAREAASVLGTPGSSLALPGRIDHQ